MQSEPFICQGCKHELPNYFTLKTPEFCYLCDPNITVEELLSVKNKILDFPRCLGYRKTEISMQICPKRKECKRLIEENQVNPFFQKMVEPKFMQKENHLSISADCENFTEFPF